MTPKTLIRRALSSINPWRNGKHAQRQRSVDENLIERVLDVLGREGNSFTFIFGGPLQGKSHALQAIISRLLGDGVPAGQILLVDFGSVLLRTSELVDVLDQWDTQDTAPTAPKYLFIDNAQWLNAMHLKELEKTVRNLQPAKLVLTGSSSADWQVDWERALGDLEIHKHEEHLRPFHFVDYLNFHGEDTARFPKLRPLHGLLNFSPEDFNQLAADMRELEIHFEKYLRVGGHPAALALRTETGAQQWTRRELIEKVLQQDIPLQHRGRVPNDTGRVLMQIAINDKLLLDMSQLCESLNLKRPVAEDHIQKLISAGLVKRISPPGYDSVKNRAMHVMLMADPAILTSLQFHTVDSPTPGLSRHALIGSAVYLHLRWGGHHDGIQIAHGHRKGIEGVQFVTRIGGHESAFDVRCLDRILTNTDLRAMGTYCALNGLQHGYVVTQSFNDIGKDEFEPDGRLARRNKLSGPVKILRIPAALLCYWWGLRGHQMSSPKPPLSGNPASTQL